MRFCACLLIGSLLLSLSACALRQPVIVSLAEPEQRRIAALFQASLRQQQACGSSLDAQAQLNLRSVWQNGSIAGFIQALAPSSLKFVGLSPLGQPLLVLTTDGLGFRTILVPESKAYEGPVSAAAFKKYASVDFLPAESFFWLSGRLASVEPQILSVAGEQDSTNYWLALSGGGGMASRRILFDPQSQLILAHILVDSEGRVLFEARYDDYLVDPSASACRRPGRITVRTEAHNGASIELILNEYLPDAALEARDFAVPLPTGFVRVPVD